MGKCHDNILPLLINIKIFARKDIFVLTKSKTKSVRKFETLRTSSLSTLHPKHINKSIWFPLIFSIDDQVTKPDFKTIFHS